MTTTTLSSYAITIAIILVIALTLSYGLQRGLGKLRESTVTKPVKIKVRL